MSDDFIDDEVAAVTYEHDDESVVVIIGSGPGGATLANELCHKGVSVVMFDAGPRFKLTHFENDERRMGDVLAWNDTRTTSGNHPLAQDWPGHPAIHVKAVGGCSIHWVGNCPRIKAHEFKALSTYGAIPGADLADWPLSFEDIEPYYVRAEDRMGVATTHGLAPMRPTNMTKILFHAARTRGYTDYHSGRVAINQLPRDGRNACDEIGFCMSGCKSGAKWSTLYTEIPKAEETGRLELRPNCMVLQVQHNGQGRVTGVLYVDKHGNQHVQKGRMVAVACNSIESPRLLLNSASSQFPDGLANSSGCVGKYHMIHINAQVYASFDKPVNAQRGRTGAGSIEDETRFDSSRGFVGGYVMLSMGGLGLSGLPEFMGVGAWGRDFASFMEDYDSIAGVYAIGEDMPLAGNRVTLNTDVKDQYGLPVPHCHFDEHPNNLAMKNHFYKQGSALWDSIGAKRIYEAKMPPATHNLGTNRMSEKARDGVVNAFGQSHDIPNLFISDGSQFTTGASCNPTLTIVGLAIRQAEYVAEQLQKNEF